MGRPRYAKKDTNQADIKAELEQVGCLVLDVSQLAPLGFDLLVCYYHRDNYAPMWLAVEVKTEDGELTETEALRQAEMIELFGDEAPITVARSAEKVLQWFKATA